MCKQRLTSLCAPSKHKLSSDEPPVIMISVMSVCSWDAHDIRPHDSVTWTRVLQSGNRDAMPAVYDRQRNAPGTQPGTDASKWQPGRHARWKSWTFQQTCTAVTCQSEYQQYVSAQASAYSRINSAVLYVQLVVV